VDSRPPALNIQEIFKSLPHRYPFLLVDRVLATDHSTFITGIKNVSINEPFFEGHFPDHPVMPGVLVVEAMAQAGVILLFSWDQGKGNRLVYFTGINNCRFRRPVVPGDQLRLEVRVLKGRGRFFKMQGEAFVDGDLVAEAELSCAVVNRT
jgi:beta-hydroxyacyl-ACP dehydratase FabZ